MKRTGLGVVLGFFAGSAAVGAIQAGQTSAVGGFTELQRAQAEGESYIELVMGLVERTDQSTSSKHYHPGGEFGFVVEGTATITREDQPDVTLEAGSSFYQPPGEWHIVTTGAEGAKSVVFRMVRKGDPMIVEIE
jgi:quercetin dioxygenase-like cupin family protein